MIEGLFAEEGDDDYSVLSPEQAKSDSLAGDSDPPTQPKGPSGFVGLLNQ
jgi:hypothetical protein